MEELKTLLEEQGKAFDAFKGGMAELDKEVKKLGGADGVLVERLNKIETALDAAAEGKAALDAAVEAERKEREELELKINRMGIAGDGDTAKREVELKEFNAVMGANASDRKKNFMPYDMKDFDEYKAAQNKFLREGKESLSSDERKTLSVGSDPDGGYWVTPDMTGRVATFQYETSPVRQVASVQVINTDALEGIEDTGTAGAGYAGEQAVSGDTTTPQIGKWRIPVYWIDTEPKATQQLLDDASVNVEAWLAAKVADKMSRFENVEFCTGATGKIWGLTAYTTAADSGAGVTWGQVGYVASGASAAFAASNPADKLHDMMGALKSAYMTNARWMTRRTVITAIRKFKDGMGNYLWQPSFVAGVPETIMGFPVMRAEDMPALAANSLSLAFGDFMAAYQIVDRMGLRVLRDPFTAKPYVKFYTTKRTGGGVVNFEAYKLMKFAVS